MRNSEKKDNSGTFFKNIVKFKRMNGSTTGKIKGKSTALLLIATAVVTVIFGTCVFALGNYNRNNKSLPTENGVLTTDNVTETTQSSETTEETTSNTEPTDSEVVFKEVDNDYFDNAVFIGDSISYGLSLYVTEKRAAGEEVLGNAQFLTSGSLSYANALWDVSDSSVHPTYNGEKMKLEDAVAQIKPDKIYILLGTNDVAIYGVEGTISNADQQINRLLEASPGAKIIIQSTTPKYISESNADDDLNNEKIDQLDVAMKAFAEEKGYVYLDIASQFKDENGGLASEYCSDQEGMGIHFTPAAYDIWIDYLYKHGV